MSAKAETRGKAGSHLNPTKKGVRMENSYSFMFLASHQYFSIKASVSAVEIFTAFGKKVG